MHEENPYNIMFGPDICGPGTKKVQVIFEHKGKNHLIKIDIQCKDDGFTHLYTIIVNPDGTYKVLIDNESAQKGAHTDNWDLQCSLQSGSGITKPIKEEQPSRNMKALTEDEMIR